jgi:hypothetical protein
MFFFVLLEEGTILKFLYLCGNFHSECACEMFVNLMAYLSSEEFVNKKIISMW